MWKFIKETLWFLHVLFNEGISDNKEPKVKFFKHYPKKKNFIYWCGYLITNPSNHLEKKLREKYYVRYIIRNHQAEEFEVWIYYYLTLLIQFISGKPWISWKGAYYTCPFIVESLFYENKYDSIFVVYSFNRWKRFTIKDRQKSWKENKRHWKSWIRDNFND